VKRYVKITDHRSRVTSFSHFQSSWKQKNRPVIWSDLSIVNFLSYSVSASTLQQKLYWRQEQWQK